MRQRPDNGEGRDIHNNTWGKSNWARVVGKENNIAKWEKERKKSEGGGEGRARSGMDEGEGVGEKAGGG